MKVIRRFFARNWDQVALVLTVVGLVYLLARHS